MDKIHIWIGVFARAEKEYWDYFDQSRAYVFPDILRISGITNYLCGQRWAGLCLSLPAAKFF
jgi:hypothetical protein